MQMMDLCVKRKKQKPVELPKLKYDQNSQEVKLLTGMPIIARINNKVNDIYNNELCTIKPIHKINDTMTITDDSDKILEIEKEMFQTLFNIAFFCTTVHKSQGSTFNHNYTVREFDKSDNKLKYVALSRSSCIDNINLI